VNAAHLLAVDPVPLGVSWAFITLIATYRAVKHYDADALGLAQRWSKYMAVYVWTGVRIVIADLGGAMSVVAANAWMNEPRGFTNRAGKVVEPTRERFARTGAGRALSYFARHVNMPRRDP
jgi:cytochrome bd-type quinol oxidase subunit 1